MSFQYFRWRDLACTESFRTSFSQSTEDRACLLCSPSWQLIACGTSHLDRSSCCKKSNFPNQRQRSREIRNQKIFHSRCEIFLRSVALLSAPIYADSSCETFDGERGDRHVWKKIIECDVANSFHMCFFHLRYFWWILFADFSFTPTYSLILCRR